MDSQRPNHVDPVEERYLSVHEASALLDVDEKELWGLVHQHQVPTHTIAGALLRFKKDDIESLKIKWRIERELFPKPDRYFPHASTVKKAGLRERLADYWYFNDFYVICSALVLVLLYFIISFQ